MAIYLRLNWPKNCRITMKKDLADALEALMPAERKSLYPILGVDEVAEIFAYPNQ